MSAELSAPSIEDVLRQVTGLVAEWKTYRYDPTMDTEWHRGHDDGLLRCAAELETALDAIRTEVLPALLTEATAEALREAADEMPFGYSYAAYRLRERADRIEAGKSCP